MFNEMGYQPALTKISEFRKSSLPCIWNFLFGIYLRCLTGRNVRLDNGILEFYAIVAGIYQNLSVDYAPQMWREFLKSVEKTNVVDGISCARYWSLILQFAYEKEGIQVPAVEDTSEFLKYNFPKTVEDNADEFPSVGRIPDGILKKVDSSNSFLQAYLKTMNPFIESGILLS